MSKNALMNFNANTLQTIERALNFYLDAGVANEIRDISRGVAGQPSETREAVLNGDYFQDLQKERDRVNLLRKQVEYQKKLLKIPEEKQS